MKLGLAVAVVTSSTTSVAPRVCTSVCTVELKCTVVMLKGAKNISFRSYEALRISVASTVGLPRFKRVKREREHKAGSIF